MSERAVDLEAVKAVQQHVWSQGDFARIGSAQVVVSERLCEAAAVIPGERVLDVACGAGNTALAAARRFARVTGIDFVPALLGHARERARAELVEAEFVEGDAERLEFADGSFDVVLSTFGAMFAPDQPRAAAELLRVCRPGGRVGMANWTPEGLVGQMFAITMRHLSPPAVLDPPPLWGTEERLRQLWGDGISDLRAERREFLFCYPSVDFCLDHFRRWFGPTKIAFEALDEPGRDALARDLADLWNTNNTAGERALVAPSAYLEVVATRAG